MYKKHKSEVIETRNEFDDKMAKVATRNLYIEFNKIQLLVRELSAKMRKIEINKERIITKKKYKVLKD